MRKKCPKCSGPELKKNGKNHCGNRKLKCKGCGHCFVERKVQRNEKRFRSEEWFRKYVSEGYFIRQIADQSGKPEHFVRADVQGRLDANRIRHIDEVFDGVRCLMADGYALPGGEILLTYRAYGIGKTVWFSFAEKEGKEEIARDLEILRNSFQYRIETFVVDGGPAILTAILTAIRKTHPGAIVQRCLVHVQRQVFNYVSKNPKTEAGKDLVRIVNYPVLSDPGVFPKESEAWKERHFAFLIEKSVSREGRRIFTHASLRKAMCHIENALPDMYCRSGHREDDEQAGRVLRRPDGRVNPRTQGAFAGTVVLFRLDHVGAAVTDWHGVPGYGLTPAS